MSAEEHRFISGHQFSDSLRIEYLDPCQDKRWDSFVDNHPYGWVTHLSTWKKVLDSSFTHMKGHYLALCDSVTGAIRAGLPVYEVRSKLLGNRLVSIPFASLTDPLVSSPDEFHVLADELMALAMKKGISRVEIRTLYGADLMADDRLSPVNDHTVQTIPLNINPEQVKLTFHKKCVRNRIDKALNSNLNIRKGEGERDIRELYSVYKLMRKRVGLPPQPYTFIRSLCETLQADNKADLLLVEDKGRTVAGMLLFKYKDRVSAEIAVMNYQDHALSPNHLLFWDAIRRSCCSGYRWFDFGRTALSNQSLVLFKSRWGATSANASTYYTKDEAEIRCRCTEELLVSRLLKKVCISAPDLIFTEIGRFCYRHVG